MDSDSSDSVSVEGSLKSEPRPKNKKMVKKWKQEKTEESHGLEALKSTQLSNFKNHTSKSKVRGTTL